MWLHYRQVLAFAHYYTTLIIISKIYHTVNRLRSFLSLGHLVTWSLGHSVFNVATNKHTHEQHQDLQVCFADNYSYYNRKYLWVLCPRWRPCHWPEIPRPRCPVAGAAWRAADCAGGAGPRPAATHHHSARGTRILAAWCLAAWCMLFHLANDGDKHTSGCPPCHHRSGALASDCRP